MWSVHSWYPLLQLLTAQPILIPKTENLLSLPQTKSPHPMKDHLVLAAWMLSVGHTGFSDKAVHLINASWTWGQIGNTTRPGSMIIIV